MLSDFIHNQTLILAGITWVIAQAIKTGVILFQQKRLDWNYMISSGGMPSAHSATVCSLATSIAMTEGMGSVYFSIAVVLAIIVMYDAAGVRQSVGEHSAFLNRLIKELSFKTTRSEREEDFREFIGHTPFQVLIGALLGIIITWLWIFLRSL
jgi:acid phosphatase family membrane protein YuiD